MQKRIFRYWLCQVLGWGGWTLLNLAFFYFLLQDVYWKSPERRHLLLAILFIEFCWYIFSTHLLRYALSKTKWIYFSTEKVIGVFVVGVMLTGLLAYYGAKSTALLTGNSLVQYEKKQSLKEAIAKEKTLGLAGTQYYLAEKNIPKDSTNYQSLKISKEIRDGIAIKTETGDMKSSIAGAFGGTLFLLLFSSRFG